MGQAETRASLAQIKADSAAMVADLARTQEQKAMLLARAEETVE